MEQLLRGEEIPAVDPYDLTKPLLWFPIRHHSPVCAWHLKKAIDAYKPDCILIEGPENAQDMIPVLAHEDTRAPIALYYFYKDSKGLLSEEKEDYKCYYPFLDYSPELTALREAGQREVPAYLIDLPYGEILLGTKEHRGIRRESEKQSYNDDYLLSRSRYLKMLCEKTGLRSFEEFWEKYFEIGGLFLKTEAFVRQMFAYCTLSRQNTPAEEMEEDGCLLRERYMAGRIAEMSARYGRILVVTGGFHTYGLMELLRMDKACAVQDTEAIREGAVHSKGEPVRLHRLSEEDQGVYPLAYSMEAADALNGYASGMQSPGFYQKVWEQLSRREEARGAYKEAVLHQLVSAARRARKQKETLSSYDVICALSMAEGLAALRGKREPGLYELRDAALSSFVKGECSPSTDLPLRILQSINTGEQAGALCEGAIRPPLLADFEEQCRKFGFKIQAASRQEVTLELFTKKKHLAISRFLYQMDFLGTDFARRKKGADLLARRDKSRIREVWTYRFSSQVLAALVDRSMFGGTVSEASRSCLIQQSAKSRTSREAARLMTSGFLMGFLEEQAQMGRHVREVLAEDGDFFSLTEGFSYLKMLYELQELYQVKDETELWELLGICFQKLVQLLPSMAQVKDEQQQECMESCRALCQMTGRQEFLHFRPVLMEAFERLLEKQSIQPGLQGAVLGLLYGYDGQYAGRIQDTAAGYLQGTREMQMKSAAFLRGLFFTARDLVFVRESFLKMVDELLGRLSAEAFMGLLPELRQAFGYFTPLETDRIAKRAAELHGAKKQSLLRGRRVSPLEYEYGEALDAFAMQRIDEEMEETV